MSLITLNHVAMMTRTTTITKKTIRMRYDDGDNGDGDDEDDEDNDDSDGHLMSTLRMGRMSMAETNTGPFARVWEVIRRV